MHRLFKFGALLTHGSRPSHTDLMWLYGHDLQCCQRVLWSLRLSHHSPGSLQACKRLVNHPEPFISTHLQEVLQWMLQNGGKHPQGSPQRQGLLRMSPVMGRKKDATTTHHEPACTW